jgi:hypothetical protein
VRNLALQKERLRILTLATQLERSEILVPRAVWNVRGVPAPLLQSKKISQRYLPFFSVIEEMLAKLRGEIKPPDFSASAAESHAREFLAKSFRLGRIFRSLETIREIEERASPLLVRRDRICQQVDDCTIPGDMPARRDGVNPLSHVGGE